MITDYAFENIENTYGIQKTEATVDVGDGTVTVHGTINGRNRCHTPKLDGVEYEREAGELIISGRSFKSGVWPQEIVEMDYRGRVSYDGDAPKTVTILHSGEEV